MRFFFCVVPNLLRCTLALLLLLLGFCVSTLSRPSFPTAQVTYNSQKREQRAFKPPGGGGVVDDVVLFSGAALRTRLDEIYCMSDEEDDEVVPLQSHRDAEDLASNAKRLPVDGDLIGVQRHPATGQAVFKTVTPVIMQLGL